MKLFVTPHRDASFALQVLNDQYNSFFRAVATALFYNRTGHNLGFGAPYSEDSEMDPIEAHGTPNHYVQECLANWLEVYVGQVLNGDHVQTFDKNVMRGDFSSIHNDGDTVPPVEALLSFLEDWYSGACLEFVSGSLDQEKFKRWFERYHTSINEFLDPYNSEKIESMRDASHSIDYKDRVGVLNELFQDQLRHPVTLYLMRPTSDAKQVEKRVVRSTSDSEIVPVAPDVNRYKSDTLATHADTVETRYPVEDDPATLFRNDSLFIVESEDGDTFHTLFAIVGDAPRFNNRNYCGRVTRSVLEDVFPKANINSILRTLYGGEVISGLDGTGGLDGDSDFGYSPTSGEKDTRFSSRDTVRSSKHNSLVASEVGDKFRYTETSDTKPALFFTDSNWEKIEDDVMRMLTFHEDVRVVRDGVDNTFVAELVDENKATPLYRLHPKRGGFSVDETESESIRNPQILTGLPNITVVFSSMEIVSLVLGSTPQSIRAMGRLIDRAKNVMGEKLLLQTIEKHSTVRDMPSLHAVNVASLEFEPYQWYQEDLQEAMRAVDDHTRYNPCMQLDSFAFVLAERNKEKEIDSDMLRFKHVYELEYGDNKVSRAHAWKRFQVNRDQIPMASSSPHKALVWDMNQLDLAHQFASEEVKHAYIQVLDSANALRYSDPESESTFERDLQIVANSVFEE